VAGNSEEMNKRVTEPTDNPIGDNSVWPPAVNTPVTVPQTRPQTLLERFFSCFVGFSIALACQPILFLLLPRRLTHPGMMPAADWPNDLTAPVRYWVGLGIITVIATVGVCWSLWDICRTWQRLTKGGKITDSAKFVLGFVAILLNGGSVVAYHVIWTMRIA
jgi:hypothetical protein